VSNTSWVGGAAVALVALAVAAGCSSDDPTVQPTPTTSSAPRGTTSATPDEPTSTATGPVVPDLVGLASAEAQEVLGELALGSSWGPPVAVGCEARPRTVVQQRPAPGTPAGPRTTVAVRTAALELERFRGPCPARVTTFGPVSEAEEALAEGFYRFAADPSLGAPFVAGEVWVGIEDGPTSTTLSRDELGELASWELQTEYAERSGPFSALDVLAESGGWYELREGVAGTCPETTGEAPPGLEGLRTLTLSSPADVTSACLEWWGVTLFLDAQDRIRGVALRLGSP
jgi:hypothetical protein